MKSLADHSSRAPPYQHGISQTTTDIPACSAHRAYLRPPGEHAFVVLMGRWAAMDSKVQNGPSAATRSMSAVLFSGECSRNHLAITYSRFVSS